MTDGDSNTGTFKSLKNYYNNNLKKVSDLYKYANHINRDELKEYLGESSSLIIYIADKYDLNNKQHYHK